ncbi:MAG: hypothetical protein IKO77_05915 [Bacteroidales bacterium]|nr:hypothetical protein [Bacteroidales bacterium]
MALNDEIIASLRDVFEEDRYGQYTNCALVFAYNGTGKTRLSYDFAHYGRGEDAPQHTLYYNAYTEDLFTWDNDHENNTDHRLLINQNSALIQGLAGTNIEDSLRKYLNIFTDIDFEFKYEGSPSDPPSYVVFSKTVNDNEIENIKISRGEERLFVWCFFRCIVDQVLGGNPAYNAIEYIYIDDPMSSLDDNNVIAFAAQLYNLIHDSLKNEHRVINTGTEELRRIKFVVSSHHSLFFHVMIHGLGGDPKLGRFYLHRDKQSDELTLKSMSDKTPFYYNVAMMSEIQEAIQEDKLYTYHFTIMRSVMEKIAEFFGHRDYRYILDDITYKGNHFEETAFSRGELVDLYSRIVNVFSHQGQFFSPTLMNEDNKDSLKTLFYHIKRKYRFILPDLDDPRSEREIHQHR